MRANEGTVASGCGLFVSCALAGFAWWNLLGCTGGPVPPAITTDGPGSVTVHCYDTRQGGSCDTQSTLVDTSYCLSAVPAEDFVSWSDCGCDTSPANPSCNAANQCEVAATGVICSANFCQTAALSLTVDGSSRVTSEPAGIDCSAATCTASFCDGSDDEEPETVTLTPTPRTGSGELFLGWDGDPDCLDGQLTMDADKSCTARFAQPEISLAVMGSGAVVFSASGQQCRSGGSPAECSREAAAGTTGTLVAVADPGATFQSWGGDCPDGAGSSSVLMDGHKSCAASFSTVAVGSGGSGAVEIISVADDESLGNGQVLPNGLSFDASDDLSVVAFVSEASNLLPGPPDVDTRRSSFVRDRNAATTGQIQPPFEPFLTGVNSLSMSADGRYVAYVRIDPSQQVYRQDLSTGVRQQVSIYDPIAGIGTYPDGQGNLPAISGNGRFVAYYTDIPIEQGELSGFSYGVAVHDSCVGAPPAPPCTPHATAISYKASGQIHDIYVAGPPGISRDGRYIVFNAYDFDSLTDFFTLVLHDRDTDEDDVYDEAGATSVRTEVALDHLAERVLLDASGRYIAFESGDADLPGNAEPSFGGRAFLHDTCVEAPPGCVPSDQLLSVQQDGAPVGETWSTSLSDLSASGRYVTFYTEDPLLFRSDPTPLGGLVGVARDTCNGAPAGCTPGNRLLSQRTDALIVANSYPSYPESRISEDGSLAALFGRRDMVVPSLTDFSQEVLLAVTGFAPEPGDVPRISSRSPGRVPPGSPELLLSVRGLDFVPGAVVSWNGSGRPTIFVSSEQLQVRIPASDLATAGVALLRVTNPGGGTSSAVSFTISGS
jgi:hypothetical protein